MKNSKRLLALAISAALAAPMAAHATNGMVLEAYGPVAGGMGGAAMAYDNGTAAMMNNPATLGMADEGNRVDVAVGRMGPDVTASMLGMPDAESSATSFIMPALGWSQKSGQMTYGAGMFAQGGMGTEYSGNSFMAAGTGLGVMSEVGVGRLIFPLAYNVNNQLTVGGSIDYVWGGMDLRMAMGAAQLGDMFAAGLVTTSANLGAQLQAAMSGGMTAARFDFEKGGAMTQATEGDGFAAKLGMTYMVNDKVTVGATYHGKTAMDDWKGDGQISMYVGSNIMGAAMPGTIIIQDFQMPAILGLGVDFKASDKLRVAADLKQIYWSDVMDSFKMRFESMGEWMNVTMPQKWDDQTVISLGAEYQAMDKLKVRAGINSGSNPIPDNNMNPMFPAIVEDHYTLGAGYDISGHQAVNMSVSIAPESTQSNSMGVTVKHSQTNMQVSYSHKF